MINGPCTGLLGLFLNDLQTGGVKRQSVAKHIFEVTFVEVGPVRTAVWVWILLSPVLGWYQGFNDWRRNKVSDFSPGTMMRGRIGEVVKGYSLSPSGPVIFSSPAGVPETLYGFFSLAFK